MTEPRPTEELTKILTEYILNKPITYEEMRGMFTDDEIKQLIYDVVIWKDRGAKDRLIFYKYTT